jgi:hypothetical protein
MRQEEMGQWRKLHSELCKFKILPNIRVTKSGKVRWAGHSGRHGGDENA